jgi:hypothetical protein
MDEESFDGKEGAQQQRNNLMLLDEEVFMKCDLTKLVKVKFL